MRATSATKILKCKIASFDSCHLSIRLTVSRWEIMTLFCSVICSRHVLGCVLRFSWMCQGEGVHSLSPVLISFFLMKWYAAILCVREKNDIIFLQKFVVKFPHVSVTFLQNPEPEVEFDTVANEKKQHEVNVG